MGEYSVAHLSDPELTSAFHALVTRDHVGTALLLVHLAEFDARRLYLSAGYASMFAYCVDALHFSETAAGKRIQAARAARKLPELFPALASGRIHLTGLCRLVPHLTQDNAHELIEAATHLRTVQIENYLAGRFPESLPQASPVASIRPVTPRAPEHVGPSETLFSAEELDASSHDDTSRELGVTNRHKEHVLGHVNQDGACHGLPETLAGAPDMASTTNDGASTVALHRAEAPHGGVKSTACEPQTFQVRVTIPKRAHDDLCEAQILLSHTLGRRDPADVIVRALDLLVRDLRRRKAGSDRPRTRSKKKPMARSRYIPAHIRRAVWERDQGQCTFMASDGHRCDERRLLEFDHVQPFARGGRATVEGLRLRCRAHNQYEAERSFGPEFMDRKRREAKAGSDAKAGRDPQAEPGTPPEPESRADPKN